MKPFKLLMFLLFFGTTMVKSQTLSQEVKSCAGGFFTNNTFMLSWTTGEVIIDTYSASNFILTQGFHQPSEINTVVVEDVVEFYNGFSPNGDGLNDFWKIPILAMYPLNRVTITNRWGSEVWRRDNYDNSLVKFEGKNMNNEDLTDGTYLYEIFYGLNLKKGWVFIKR